MMLLSYLFQRAQRRVEADSFKWRGEGVSRIEGFSDTVFGFALTLLVISARAPDTSAELLSMQHAVLPFVASFLVLFSTWRLQFDFFRRYGLEDSTTVWLTGLLLMIVLLAIYPLKFLCTFIFDVLPVAIIAGNDSMRTMMPMEKLPHVLLLYAIGFSAAAALFSRLYRHAASQHVRLGLSELELFDTRTLERRFANSSIMLAAVALWSIVLLSLGEHTQRRDMVWRTVYLTGVPIVLLLNRALAFRQRHLVRHRAEIVRTADTLHRSTPGAE